jgi:DNA-binding NtrC family response regulator
MADNRLIDTLPGEIGILVVDDEECMRDLVGGVLAREGFAPRIACNVTDAIGMLRERPAHLLVTDLSMPGSDGIELIQHVRRWSPSTVIVVITGYPSEERIEQLEELRVYSFLIKPFSVKQLRFSVFGALQACREGVGAAASGDELLDNSAMGIIGRSEYIERLRTRVSLMASGEFPVLVQGDSGSGKEVIAQAIHGASVRKDQTMVTINCAAIPAHLEEAEFFGYGKGAFTGAHTAKKGILEVADNSTVFLDEIGELSPNVQAKLLRVLDGGEFLRIGELQPHHVNIRIISATNRNLQSMVEEGAFRQDLYYRLKGAIIETMPLQSHAEDIPLLARHFLDSIECRLEITDSAMRMLQEYPWPGNVRELKNVLRHLAALCRDTGRIDSQGVNAAIGRRECEPDEETVPYRQAREAFERDYFAAMLRRENGNVSQVAREAGLHRPALIRKLKELGISANEYRGD